MSGFALCGTGGGSTAQSSRYIGYGETDVLYPDWYYLQDEEGEFVLDERDERILLDSIFPPILDEDGNPVTDEEGNITFQEEAVQVGSPYILDEQGEIELDQDDRPGLDENFRNYIIQGIATQLESTLSIRVQHITIQAKTNNIGKIWIAGRSVTFNRGVYLGPTFTYVNGVFVALVSEPTTIAIDRLTKIWIIGNAGEGVRYIYGTNENITLENTDGEIIENTDGEDITNP